MSNAILRHIAPQGHAKTTQHILAAQQIQTRWMKIEKVEEPAKGFGAISTGLRIHRRLRFSRGLCRLSASCNRPGFAGCYAAPRMALMIPEKSVPPWPVATKFW